MALQERAGRAFTKCDAFWDADIGETLTGVLIDCNENFPDKLKGKDAVKPLYIFKLTGEKTDQATLQLENDKGEKKDVKIKKGLIVGVFDCDELNVKIFQKYGETVGRLVQMTYTAKEPFTAKNGAQRTAKRYKVLVDDQVHAEFGKDVAKRAVGASAQAPASNGSQGDTGPYDVNG